MIKPKAKKQPRRHAKQQHDNQPARIRRFWGYQQMQEGWVESYKTNQAMRHIRK